MSTKHERHAQEVLVFQLRSEAGIQALRTWAYAQRNTANERWFNMSGDELLQLQGEAKIVAQLIKMIDVGPTIKETA